MTEFDKLFRDNLQDGTEKTPSFIWDNIENEIEQKPKKRKFFLFWFLAGLSVLIGSIAIYWTMSGASEQSAIQMILLEKKQLQIRAGKTNSVEKL